MIKKSVIFLFTLLCFSTLGFAQTPNDLKGTTSPFEVVKPKGEKKERLLVINNIIFCDTNIISCVVKKINPLKVKKVVVITAYEAEKRGFKDVPKDGILFVTTKKGYFVELECKD